MEPKLHITTDRQSVFSTDGNEDIRVVLTQPGFDIAEAKAWLDFHSELYLPFQTFNEAYQLSVRMPRIVVRQHHKIEHLYATGVGVEPGA